MMKYHYNHHLFKEFLVEFNIIFELRKTLFYCTLLDKKLENINVPVSKSKFNLVIKLRVATMR